jgi:DNA-binding MarR family transcriptional regulator
VPATRHIAELRKLRILEEIMRGTRVSQRDLARKLNISAAFLNRCLHDLEHMGYVEVSDRGVRPFLYRITSEGERFRRALLYRRYNSIIARFLHLERRIHVRLVRLKEMGVRRIVCYGAGEMMDLTRKCADEVGLEIVAGVDDDLTKHNSNENGVLILAPSSFESLDADAVLFTGLVHGE